jgi:hypothetical protein
LVDTAALSPALADHADCTDCANHADHASCAAYHPHSFAPNPPLVAHHMRRRNWRTLGYVLVGIGGLIVIEQLGSAVLTGLAPLLLVVSGVLLLLRQRL